MHHTLDINLLHNDHTHFILRVTEARRKIETSVDIGSEKMMDSIGNLSLLTNTLGTD